MLSTSEQTRGAESLWNTSNNKQQSRVRIFDSTKSLELSFIMKLLKAGEASIGIHTLSQELSFSEEVLLRIIRQLEESELISRIDNGMAVAVPVGEDRLRLAVAAVRFGATIEDSAGKLSWKEFEAFCSKVLEENGYSCFQGFRFKSPRGRRYECDIAATMDPLILLADCKHYAGHVKGLNAAVDKHLERVDAFAKSVPTLVRRIPQILEWNQATITPIIVTLFPENITIIEGVPIVPVFKLNQFLQEITSNIDKITHMIVEPSKQKKLNLETETPHSCHDGQRGKELKLTK